MIAFGLAAGLQAAGVLPFGDGSSVVEQEGDDEALRAEIETLRSEIAQLRDQPAAESPGPGSARMEALGGRIDQLAGTIEELRTAQSSDSPAGASGDGSALAERLAAIEASQSALTETADPSALESLRETVSALENSIAAQQQTTGEASEARSEFASRLDAVEERLAALGETVEGQPRMARAIAATALKSAVDRGDPFTAELDTYAAVAPDPGLLEALRATAAAGIPTADEIETAMDANAPAMIDAARPDDPEAGLVDRLMSSAQSLVSVRPIGAVEGDGVEAIVARMEAAIGAGDYEMALTEYDSLPATAQAAGSDLAGSIRARMEADAALAAIMSGAVRPDAEESGNAPANGG